MERKDMIDRLSRKLHEWDTKLESLEERMAARKDEAKARMRRKHAETKERRDLLEQRLAAAKDSAESGWDKVSGELEDAWKAFRDAAEETVEAARS